MTRAGLPRASREMRAEWVGRQPDRHEWKDYGGRGITVCDRWSDYALFVLDMGHRPSPYHSIERKDNNKGYEPGNCRWATNSEQQRNTRRSRHVDIGGVSKTVAEWCELYGISNKTVYSRVKSGWDFASALATPSGRPGHPLSGMSYKELHR